MPQARDEAGNIWETDAQGNPVRLIRAAPQQGGVVVPGDPVQNQQSQANVTRTRTQTAIDQAQLPYAGPQAAANAAQAAAAAESAAIETEQTRKEMTEAEMARSKKAVRQAYQTDSILRAIRNARRIAQNEGGTGWESLLASLPATTARRLQSELSPIFGNLAFDRLQQMRDESVTGGALGQVSERELDLLASTVASLDTGVDVDTFLRRLDEIERRFMDAQLTNMGIPEDDAVRQNLYKTEFDYKGVFDSEIPQEQTGLADPNATQRVNPVPPEMQAEHLRYLRENYQNLSPSDYAAFRVRLDEKYGFGSRPQEYQEYGQYLRERADKGLELKVGPIPSPMEDMSALEQGMNFAAQNPLGTYFANAGNAIGVGLPAYLSGQRDNLELLREINPGAAFLGEVSGTTLGSVIAGGAAANAARGLAAGSRAGQIASNPLTADAAYNAAYGFSEDGLRGAGVGVVGSLGGEALGRVVGGAFPKTFAPGSTRAADESVPQIDDLRAQRDRQYQRAEGMGQQMTPQQTEDLNRRLEGLLESYGDMSPSGNIIGDGPNANTVRLSREFSGQPMTPTQANALRQKAGRGRIAMEGTQPDYQTRNLAGEMVGAIDDVTVPNMPGIRDARETAQRVILSREMQATNDLADANTQMFSASGAENAYRNAYRQLDKNQVRGRKIYPDELGRAIEKVSRGDGVGNLLRNVGRFAPTGPVSALPTAMMGGLGYSATGDLTGLALGGATAAVTGASRKLAEAKTRRAAEVAELMARGGPEYERLLRIAEANARINAGRIGGGLFGGMSQSANRNYNQNQ